MGPFCCCCSSASNTNDAVLTVYFSYFFWSYCCLHLCVCVCAIVTFYGLSWGRFQIRNVNVQLRLFVFSSLLLFLMLLLLVFFILFNSDRLLTKSFNWPTILILMMARDTKTHIYVVKRHSKVMGVESIWTLHSFHSITPSVFLNLFPWTQILVWIYFFIICLHAPSIMRFYTLCFFVDRGRAKKMFIWESALVEHRHTHTDP